MVEQKLKEMSIHVPSFPRRLDEKVMNRIKQESMKKSRFTFERFRIAYAMLPVLLIVLTLGLVTLLNHSNKISNGDPIVITNIGQSDPLPLSVRILYSIEISGDKFRYDDEITIKVYYGHMARPNTESPLEPLKNLKISIQSDAFEILSVNEIIIEDISDKKYFIENYWDEKAELKHYATFSLKLRTKESQTGLLNVFINNYEDGYVPKEEEIMPAVINKSIYYFVDESQILFKIGNWDNLYYEFMDERYESGKITALDYMEDDIKRQIGANITLNMGTVTKESDPEYLKIVFTYVSKNLRFNFELENKHQDLYSKYKELISRTNPASDYRDEYELIVKEIFDILLNNQFISTSEYELEMNLLNETNTISSDVPYDLNYLIEKIPNIEPEFIQFKLH